MIYGFAITKDSGATCFGVVNADNENDAEQFVIKEVCESSNGVSIITAEEALNQYGSVAFLIPAEC